MICYNNHNNNCYGIDTMIDDTIAYNSMLVIDSLLYATHILNTSFTNLLISVAALEFGA